MKAKFLPPENYDNGLKATPESVHIKNYVQHLSDTPGECVADVVSAVRKSVETLNLRRFKEISGQVYEFRRMSNDDRHYALVKFYNGKPFWSVEFSQ